MLLMALFKKEEKFFVLQIVLLRLDVPKNNKLYEKFLVIVLKCILKSLIFLASCSFIYYCSFLSKKVTRTCVLMICSLNCE